MTETQLEKIKQLSPELYDALVRLVEHIESPFGVSVNHVSVILAKDLIIKIASLSNG